MTRYYIKTKKKTLSNRETGEIIFAMFFIPLLHSTSKDDEI
jgi:hypothetical protein